MLHVSVELITLRVHNLQLSTSSKNSGRDAFRGPVIHFPANILFLLHTCIGGDIWIDGSGGESQIYPGADEVVSGQEGLHKDPDHQQEDQHQVLL